ncbi:hypothetical protein D3C76_815520 [compost metagenome]
MSASFASRLQRRCARLLAPALLALACQAGAATDIDKLPVAQIDKNLSQQQLTELSRQAFFWGMQQAGFYELRYLFTQAEGKPTYRGLNRLQPVRRLFTAKERFATTPNSSTLYSGGFFDLSQGPALILSPDVTDGRYWSIQAMDQYAHWFFMAGSPFTGNQAQRYVIVGPSWKGALPEGFRATEIIRATSDSIVLTQRVAVMNVSDPADLRAASTLLDTTYMLPLKLWQANGEKPLPLTKQPIVKADYPSFPRMDEIGDLTRSMKPLDYLQLLSLVLNDDSMTQRSDSVGERETLQKLAGLGLQKGKRFDPAPLDAEQIAAIGKGFDEARKQARQSVDDSLIDMNGWKLQSSLGYDDNDYVLRAGAAEIAWGSPVPYQSHTIAFGMQDARGEKLQGDQRYTLTFDLDKLPPVSDFWELPVYDEYGYFIDNPIDRYSVTSYMLKNGQLATHDGRLTLYLQSTPPSDPEQLKNWLPTPVNGTFRFAARFYGPTSGLVDGSYAMPRVERLTN